ncbi:MAG: hypothetical protein DMF65_00285, partial [Acidobacteria bacterium]
MFALQDHDEAKKRAKGKPGREDPAPGGKCAPKQNPLWQSLALRPIAVRSELSVSRPDDPDEQEADRVAERVTRMAAPPPCDASLSLALTSQTFSKAQRKCGACEEEEEKLRRKK